MSEINHTERAHSRIGASSSKRWFNCPASAKLSEGVEQKTSVYAEEGTAAHELAEYCLKEELDAVHGVGLEFNGFKVTMEMAEAVQVYLDTIRNMMNDQCDILIEERFHLHWIDEELFGSNDCAIIDYKNKKVIILDYKHGRGVAVEAIENPQLMYYALGGINGLEQFFDVELVIVQPRCDHPDGPVRIWKTDVERLEQFEEELKERVAKVREADEASDPYEYASEGKHCHFCPANGFCKKLRDKSYEVAMVEFKDETITPPPPENLTPEQLTRVLSHATIMEKWLDSVRKYAHQEAEAGVQIKGMKLVKARANRKWKDESVASEELGFLLDDKDMYTKKFITPAQAEKLLGKGVIDELVTAPDKGTSLVKETDKRPAVTPAVDMFDL